MKLRVVTLNVWCGGKLFDEVIDFLLQANADIVLLQEVYNGQETSLSARFRTLETLKAKLAYEHYDYEPEIIDNRSEGKIPQGNAIFSKWPIIDRQVTFFDRPLDENYVDKPENFATISRNVERVTIDSPGGAIDCLNFHGVWDLDGDNYSEARKNMSDVLIREVEGKANVILGGDTNAKPTNQSMKSLESSLNSVFGDSLATTFNMRQKSNPGYATAAVDMLFVSRNIKVLSAECPDVNVSDHLPLIADLEL